MAKRKRANRFEFRVSDEEKKLIYKRMQQVGFQNFGAFARKMLMNGVVVNPVIQLKGDMAPDNNIPNYIYHDRMGDHLY